MKAPAGWTPPEGAKIGPPVNVAALGLSPSQVENVGAKTGQEKKYGNTKVIVGGIQFDSKTEAERFQVLRLLVRAGIIRDLEPHPVYELVVNGTKVGHFTLDSRYTIVATGEKVVEDVKSEPTRKKEAYRLRVRLLKAVYGIDVKEICKG